MLLYLPPPPLMLECSTSMLLAACAVPLMVCACAACSSEGLRCPAPFAAVGEPRKKMGLMDAPDPDLPSAAEMEA